jgi:hypothetical protein
MSEPTPEIVKAFYEAGVKEFDVEIMKKTDSKKMELVAKWLNFWGVKDYKDFMENYTTTVGESIYNAFEIGVPGNGWGLVWQMTTLVHELRHVLQYRESKVLFPIDYATSRSARTHYECQAFAADMELWHWLTGRDYPIGNRVGSLLRGYNIKQMHADYAQVHLDTIHEIVKEGGVTDDIADWAITWCEENAPELKGG